MNENYDIIYFLKSIHEIPWHLPLFKISLTFFKIAWLFPDAWQPCRMFAPPFVQAQIKENIKTPRHWPLWEESTGDRRTHQHAKSQAIPSMHPLENTRTLQSLPVSLSELAKSTDCDQNLIGIPSLRLYFFHAFSRKCPETYYLTRFT